MPARISNQPAGCSVGGNTKRYHPSGIQSGHHFSAKVLYKNKEVFVMLTDQEEPESSLEAVSAPGTSVPPAFSDDQLAAACMTKFFVCPGSSKDVIPYLPTADTESQPTCFVNIFQSEKMEELAKKRGIHSHVPLIDPQQILERTQLFLKNVLRYVIDGEAALQNPGNTTSKKSHGGTMTISDLKENRVDLLPAFSCAQWAVAHRRTVKDPNQLNPILYLVSEMCVFAKFNNTTGQKHVWAVPTDRSLQDSKHTLFQLLLPVFIEGVRKHQDVFNSIIYTKDQQSAQVKHEEIESLYKNGEQATLVSYTVRSLTAISDCIQHMRKELNKDGNAFEQTAPHALRQTCNLAVMVEFLSQIQSIAVRAAHSPERSKKSAQQDDVQPTIAACCNQLYDYCGRSSISPKALFQHYNITVAQLRNLKVPTDYLIQFGYDQMEASLDPQVLRLVQQANQKAAAADEKATEATNQVRQLAEQNRELLEKLRLQQEQQEKIMALMLANANVLPVNRTPSRELPLEKYSVASQSVFGINKASTKKHPDAMSLDHFQNETNNDGGDQLTSPFADSSLATL